MRPHAPPAPRPRPRGGFHRRTPRRHCRSRTAVRAQRSWCGSSRWDGRRASTATSPGSPSTSRRRRRRLTGPEGVRPPPVSWCGGSDTLDCVRRGSDPLRSGSTDGVLIVVSPAKALDFESPLATKKYTVPTMMDEARQLVSIMSRQTPDDLSAMMSISPALAELNFERFQDWEPPTSPDPARPAVLAFNGDTYICLLYTSDAADDLLCVDLGGRRIIKKK